MKTLVLTVVTFFVLSTSASCNNSEDNEELEAGSLPSSEPQALLFTDENNEDIEQPYYDALIDFQYENDEQTEVTIVRENEPSVEDYDIEEYPTLILVKDDHSDTFISGKHSSEEILTLLQDHFSQN